MLVDIIRMILGTSKGGTVRQKKAEVGGQILGGDCRGGCMHKKGHENETATTIWLRMQDILY